MLLTKVVINGRREDVIKATAEELNAAIKESGSGGEVIAIQADVATKQGVVEFFDKCSKVIDKV
jgi:NAD(P)-dependent dehydrogenase (short-subunit alcohol dehydrogenase family)